MFSRPSEQYTVSTPLIVTDAALRSRCRELFPVLSAHDIILLDESYQVLREEDTPEAYSHMVDQALLVFPEYQTMRKDCDKCSRFVASIAMATHAVISGPDAGLAFGILNYVQDADKTPSGRPEGHSINIVFARPHKEQRIVAMLFDPRKNEQVELTSSERRNVTLIFV